VDRTIESKCRHGERVAVHIQRGNIHEIDIHGSKRLAVVLQPGAGQWQSGKADPASRAVFQKGDWHLEDSEPVPFLKQPVRDLLGG
jgi:hypothetical protein